MYNSTKIFYVMFAVLSTSASSLLASTTTDLDSPTSVRTAASTQTTTEIIAAQKEQLDVIFIKLVNLKNSISEHSSIYANELWANMISAMQRSHHKVNQTNFPDISMDESQKLDSPVSDFTRDPVLKLIIKFEKLCGRYTTLYEQWLQNRKSQNQL